MSESISGRRSVSIFVLLLGGFKIFVMHPFLFLLSQNISGRYAFFFFFLHFLKLKLAEGVRVGYLGSIYRNNVGGWLWYDFVIMNNVD